jgi:hypothetical protein
VALLTPSQRRMLENIRDGRDPSSGFEGARSASFVAQALYERGWTQHSDSDEGPPMVLTERGREALREHTERGKP